MNASGKYFADDCWVVASEEFHRGQSLDVVEYEIFKNNGYPVRNCDDHSDDSNDAWIEKIVNKESVHYFSECLM